MMKKIKKTDPSNHFSIKVNFYEVKNIVSEDWIKKICYTILENEKKNPYGNISIVLVSDKYISKLNKKFLNKELPTDVLAFPMNDDDLWGEIYISTDRAIEQSEYYKVNLHKELARLIIHGILHLLGYDDKKTESRNHMRKKENYYIEKLKIS